MYNSFCWRELFICLSPTLFNIYTNDMPTNPGTYVSLFADDTIFHCINHKARYASIQLQRQLNSASEWFTKWRWRLRINETKTVAILFGWKRTSGVRQLEINNLPITWSKSVKYLGVTIDQNLNFSSHATNIVKKVTKIRGLLYPILNKSSLGPKDHLDVVHPNNFNLCWCSMGTIYLRIFLEKNWSSNNYSY